MKQTIRRILPLIITLALSPLLVTPSAVFADDICNSLSSGSAAYEANGCGGSDSTLEPIFISIINGVMGIIALVAVIAIIIGGVQYMTSTGDPGKVKKAKDTIMYAVIGLIVVIFAVVIVNFVIGSLVKAQ